MPTSFPFRSLWLYPRNRSKGHILRSQRQADDERRPLRIRIVVTGDLTVVFANNAVADAQSQPCSLTHFLGCEERIKDAVGISNAGAVVAKTNLNKRTVSDARDLNARRPSRLPNRIVRVIQDIEEHLLQLVGIADHFRERLVQ